MTKNNLTKLALILAAGALLVSFYLVVSTGNGGVPPCSVGNCEQVLTSKYSHIGGISLAWLGAFFDLVLVFLLTINLGGKNRRLEILTKTWIGVGVAVSLGLIAIQYFLIRAFCIWCSVHAGLILILGLILLMLRPRSKE